MGVTGPEFAADLGELRIIGRIDLPMIGYTYAAVNNAVADTADQDTAAFQTAAGGSLSRIADSWPDLRDQLQNILGRTAANVQSAGRTVEHIVATYLEGDELTRDVLNDAWAHGSPPGAVDGEKPPTDQPPTVKMAS